MAALLAGCGRNEVRTESQTEPAAKAKPLGIEIPRTSDPSISGMHRIQFGGHVYVLFRDSFAGSGIAMVHDPDCARYDDRPWASRRDHPGTYPEILAGTGR